WLAVCLFCWRSMHTIGHMNTPDLPSRSAAGSAPEMTSAAAAQVAAHPFSFDPAVEAKIRSRAKLFVAGPFGSGKTALAIERARWLLRQERVRGDDILILVPQPLNLRAFREALAGAKAPIGAPVEITTVASVARNAVELYWPLIAPEAGF